MSPPSDFTFDAHIAPILAGDHAPGLRDEVLEIQSLLARIAFPRRSDPRAASLVASLQARLSSRLGGNLQRWKDLGDEEKQLYIVMGLGQANVRFNTFATIHLNQEENETAEQVADSLLTRLRRFEPGAELLAVEALDRGIRHIHALISVPKAPTTRAGRTQLREIVAWFDERNAKPGIAWKNGSGVSAHLEWLDEQKIFQRVGVGGLLGAACYMAAQRKPRLVAGRNLRAIGKQLHADATESVRLALSPERRSEVVADRIELTEAIEAQTPQAPLARAFDRDADVLRRVAGNLIRAGRLPQIAVRDTLAAWRSLRAVPLSPLG